MGRPVPLMTQADVAEMLGTSDRHVRRLIERRAIPVVKVGRLNRFRQRDVEAWLEANTVASSSGSAA